MNQYINMPDGEVLAVPAFNTTHILVPYADEATVQTWVNLNYLARPPITDAEILMMTPEEIINLYYDLAKVHNYNIKPDPKYSNGLAEAGVKHEVNLQQRVYNVRTDLHTITDPTGTYQVLCDPKYLRPPPNPNAGAGMALSVIGTIGAFIPIIGWVVSLGIAAYQAVDSIEKAKSALNAARASQAVADSVTTGIDLAKRTLPIPVPDKATVDSLKNQYQNWHNNINLARQIGPKLAGQLSHINDAAYYLVIAAGGPEKAWSDWQPYSDYFISEHVRDLVFPTQDQASSSTASAPAVGLGIGALLLLLL